MGIQLLWAWVLPLLTAVFWWQPPSLCLVGLSSLSTVEFLRDHTLWERPLLWCKLSRTKFPISEVQLRRVVCAYHWFSWKSLFLGVGS